MLDPCDPIGRGGNNHISLEAIQYARTLDTPVLIVEDDIDLAPDFTLFLNAALDQGDVVTYFYLNDKVDRLNLLLGGDAARSILAGEPQHRRLARARHYRGLFGTQCVLLPQAVLPTIEDRLRVHGDALDMNTVRALQGIGWPAFIALPHPVQHRHDRTARTPDARVKRSMSFDLPRISGEGVSA